MFCQKNFWLLESVINQAINKMNDLTSNWFEQKQQEYKKSILLTVNLLDHQYNIGKNTAINRFKDDKKYIFQAWSKQAIIDRQKIMLDLALDVWRFNDQRLDQYQFSIEYKDTVNA